MSEAAPHILVVDDDAQVRRMLRRCFEEENYRVSEADDQAGVGAALETGIDLITLNLNLGGIDGLSIARAVRQRWDLPIIMITGKGDMIDRIVGLELGADDYIAKPFHLREVLARCCAEAVLEPRQFHQSRQSGPPRRSASTSLHSI